MVQSMGTLHGLGTRAYWMSLSAWCTRCASDNLSLTWVARSSSPDARTSASIGCTMQAVPAPNISLRRRSEAAFAQNGQHQA